MEYEDIKFTIKSLHGHMARAYNMTYSKLAKSNSHEEIESAVHEIKGKREAGEENPVHFAALKGLHLTHKVVEQLAILYKAVPDIVETDLVMQMVGQAFNAGLCVGSAHHGHYARITGDRLKPFAEACKKSRADDLKIVLEEIVLSYIEDAGCFPSTKEIIRQLIELARDYHQVIQEVNEDDEIVLWVSKKGEERETSYSRVGARITKIKKKYEELTKCDSRLSP